MANTNVELSKTELELVTNAELILTKNRIIEKVYNLFGLLSDGFRNSLNKHTGILSAEVFSTSPKIYKGENYLGLPYVMMDYPRVFLKDDVFAIRSFFWWGNYFSLTLQLSGKYLNAFRNNIEVNLKNEMHEAYFICVNDERWEHHFKETNYKPLKEINSINELLNKPFIKIAKQLPLNKWNIAEAFFENSYEIFLKLITV